MPSQHSLVVLFDVLVLVGTVLSLCTFLPAILSKNIYRSIGWYSLMTAWLVYSLSYALLIGKQEGPDPPFGLCVFQSLLVYAAPPLVATGLTCYYIEFYLIVHRLRRGNPSPYSPRRTFWLVVTPWLVFLSVILEVLLLIFPEKRLSLVGRAVNDFYCHLEDGIPNLVSASIILANAVILLPLEVWTGYVMHRYWDVFRRLTRTDRQIFLTVYLRLFFCTVVAVVAFVFSTVDFVFPATDETSLVYPMLPIFIAFAFGTQKDLMRAWLFWRPHRPYGSIVFNHSRGGGGSGSSSGGALTTNVYTLWGTATVTPETSGGRWEPLWAVWEWLSPRLLKASFSLQCDGEILIVQPRIDHSVHFELQERSRSQVFALQQRLGAEAARMHLQNQPTKVLRHSGIDS
ncbi:hypothetical protein Ac2012v2_002369 [Leucoagaricus gongylophorus]